MRTFTSRALVALVIVLSSSPALAARKSSRARPQPAPKPTQCVVAAAPAPEPAASAAPASAPAGARSVAAAALPVVPAGLMHDGNAPAAPSSSAAPASPETVAPASPSAEAPKPVRVAPVLGYASADLRLGVGVRANYTFPWRGFVGATFVYHLGSSEERSVLGKTFQTSSHTLYSGAEFGYEAPVGPIAIRPYVGVGVLSAMVSSSSAGRETSASTTSLGFWPGVEATYSIPSTVTFVGADARAIVSLDGGSVPIAFFLTGGARF